MSWAKIHAFCIDQQLNRIFAGNVSGEILTIDIDSFEIKSRCQAHAGTIVVMAKHPLFPYIGILSKDRSISVWEYLDGGKLSKLFDFSNRYLEAQGENGKFIPVHSVSQAFAFHPTERRLLARTANGCLAEVCFDELGNYEMIQCFRPTEQLDIATCCYVGKSDLILTGSGRGHMSLHQDGKIIKRWQLDNETIHWFEPYINDHFIFVGDSRKLFQIDLTQSEPVKQGFRFANDDLEHATFHRATGRIFAASFDRRIYEIDSETLSPKGIVFNAPFKCRWIKVWDINPEILIVQCRNGGLYKVDLTKKNSVGIIKETPNALWSATYDCNDEIIICGEGKLVFKLKPKLFITSHTRQTVFEGRTEELDSSENFYSKRCVVHSHLNITAYGRSNGDLLIYEKNQINTKFQLDSAIRDIAFHAVLPIIFVCCEDGNIYKIDVSKKCILKSYKSELPIWALAYNAELECLAVSERMGAIILLSSNNLDELNRFPNRFCKRIKWIDKNRFLFNSSNKLHIYNVETATETIHVMGNSNTIEDFVWDPEKKYLILVTYSRHIFLCDFSTGKILDRVRDQIDYAKGILFLRSDMSMGAYPYEFITYGREGTIHLYHIHDDQIISKGIHHL